MWYECRKAALSYLEIYCNDKTVIKYLFYANIIEIILLKTIGIESISDNNTWSESKIPAVFLNTASILNFLWFIKNNYCIVIDIFF